MQPTTGTLVQTGLAVFDPNLGDRQRVGIVLSRRWRDCSVLFIDSGRTFWIPRSLLREVELRVPDELALVHDLFHRLGADGIELAEATPPQLAVRLTHPEIDLGAIDVLRAELGARLITWRLRPAGLRRIESELELLPGAPARGSSSRRDA